MADRSAGIEVEALGKRVWAGCAIPLDRFSGRYTDTGDEQTRPRSVFSLLPERRTGIDFLPVAQSVTKYLPLVDSPRYGGASHGPWPMAPSIEVTILSSGALLPRPSNEAAAEAVAGWHN